MKGVEKNIPDGWIETNFGDIKYFKILGSGIKSFDGVKNYLSTSSIDLNKVISIEEEISFRKRPSRANMQPIENSVWFAKMKNTIKVFNPTFKDLESVILSTGFCGIQSEKVISDLLEQFFLSNRFNIQKDILSIGSTQEAINNTKVKNIEFVFPKSKKEQQKIAQILTKIDDAITQTEKLIAKYQRIKTGLMQDLLTKGIDKDGKIRSEVTHKFKDSPLGRIPVDWGYSSLGKIKEFITSGSRGWAKYYSVEGSQFIRITNLRRNQIEINTEEMKYVNLANQSEGIRSRLIEGDLLISITADLGIIGVVPQNFGEAYINQHIALVRLVKDDVNPKFIGYFLTSVIGQSIFNILNDGGAKAGLNLNTITEIPVFLPKKDEQNIIVDRIEQGNETINILKIQLEKLKNQKTGLMQDLLSGKKRVTHLLKE